LKDGHCAPRKNGITNDQRIHATANDSISTCWGCMVIKPMKLTQKKITYRKKKNNPVAKMLKSPEFRQQKVSNKKVYDRKINNAGLLKMLDAV
jgi:hypothetical protein